MPFVTPPAAVRRKSFKRPIRQFRRFTRRRSISGNEVVGEMSGMVRRPMWWVELNRAYNGSKFDATGNVTYVLYSSFYTRRSTKLDTTCTFTFNYNQTIVIDFNVELGTASYGSYDFASFLFTNDNLIFPTTSPSATSEPSLTIHIPSVSNSTQWLTQP
ncbi:hypothetical protein GQ457_07G003910 [Hibiscus cannabinus]